MQNNRLHFSVWLGLALLGRVRRSNVGCGLLLLGLFLGLSGSLNAFPPAPYYTIFGDVRDEFGSLVPSGATVIFYYQAKEVARYPVTAVAGQDYNYQIRMRLDMNSAGTAVYNSIAVQSGLPYSLKVDIGGVTYLPIEISAKAPTVGTAADRKRLDLTLGVDKDLDGLPDAWERALLQRLGLPLDDLWRITPDGVLEADGLTNLQKYLSGTYSGDTSQSFYLKIKEVTDTDVFMDFYTLTNKVYSIEKSGDLVSWSPVSFTVGVGSTVSVYTATGAEVVTARVPWVSGEEKAFYRLKVR
jgi:hypothetical protein